MADKVSVIGSKGEQLNLLIRQGGTFGPYRMTLRNPDGTPLNLSDISFRGQIRKTFDDLQVAATFEFRIPNPATGLVEFEISATQTAALGAGEDENSDDSIYVYDIELLDETDRVTPVIYGQVNVFREVTK